jgi:hypothetical protein
VSDANPSPSVLWEQAAGDGQEYRRLMREHGHLIGPGDPGYDPGAPRSLPCGWPLNASREIPAADPQERMPVWHRVAWDYARAAQLTGTLTLDGEEYEALPDNGAARPVGDASAVLRRVRDGQEFRAMVRIDIKPVQRPVSLGPFDVVPLSSLRRGVAAAGATRYVQPGGLEIGHGLVIRADRGGSSWTPGRDLGDLGVLSCCDSGTVLAHPEHGQLLLGPGPWLVRCESGS